MLRSVTELQTYTMGATDGEIGRVKDCYFDDEAWVIRYLVVKTGVWLVGREVLISPFSVGDLPENGGTLSMSITKEQIRNSPSIDTQQPVSRQHEMQYSAYYGYPYYWGGVGMWGIGAYPRGMPGSAELGMGPRDADRTSARGAIRDPSPAQQGKENVDQHLRSCEAVKGYHVHATDGDIGHIDGFIIDEQSWAIRYLIVNTGNWWLGHQVLIAPAWFDEVSWVYSKVKTRLTREEIKNAPPYDSLRALNRGDEESMYGHYRREGYWRHESGREVA